MFKCAKLTIKGIVQGVGLRYRVERYANGKGLKGWIRNEPDGTVCCLLQNDALEVNEFIVWLKSQSGISGIDEIEVDCLELEGDYQNFKIIY